MAKKKVETEVINNEELKEAEIIDQEEVDNDIPDDELDEDFDDEEEDEDPEKPGLFKRIIKGTWKWIKRLAPAAGGFAAGFAVKTLVSKSLNTGNAGGIAPSPEVPALPEVTTTTVDLGDGNKAEVTTF